jgi:hypothetical protein
VLCPVYRRRRPLSQLSTHIGVFGGAEASPSALGERLGSAAALPHHPALALEGIGAIQVRQRGLRLQKAIPIGMPYCK